ncbi:uncharacterized protein RHIMIDRAFT_279304 [Rhizopus microsporus ATCC 52813]|uniref:Uncharacterized protein n=1 Tax=Rhizopus microsporus ATCC 52813 TaxID=1340429 RepID=A0A2G4SX88_RHIZD|nr:uncharacterized protein RHIMIDRAFT_279304 [Rhizopus microsporus ATCC 52813]PHZ13418.1 hypothetical protein RHIMIDRAFT_279304 [Rhizopus microsporus ATCC 52813]
MYKAILILLAFYCSVLTVRAYDCVMEAVGIQETATCTIKVEDEAECNSQHTAMTMMSACTLLSENKYECNLNTSSFTNSCKDLDGIAT